MGLFGRIREALGGVATDAHGNPLTDEDRLSDDGHKLIVPSGYNVRELGGYTTPEGTTLYHRYLRCGGTRSLTRSDLEFFRRWGVTRVLDLRGMGEAPVQTCAFARQPWVIWENVSLFDHDISAPEMVPSQDVDNYLVSSYLHMLRRRAAVKRVIDFLADTPRDECALFHCAAGMDRTGMVGMLLLSLADVSREQIIADYSYSFASRAEVDEALAHWDASQGRIARPHELGSRIEAVSVVYDTLVENYGSVREFLKSCELSDATLDAVRAHLTE